MPREYTEAERTEGGHGDSGYTETHPSFGVAVVNRVTSTGTTLFQSDLVHHEFVVLRIHGAKRIRDLSRDWVHAGEEIVEVEMSLAQWASLVSSFGVGGGVPVTITRRQGVMVEGAVHRPRMAESLSEVRAAADRVLSNVRTAVATFKEAFERGATKKRQRALLDDVERLAEQATGNAEFVTKQMESHVEKVVTQAKADIEGMVERHAIALGIDPESTRAFADHMLEREPPKGLPPAKLGRPGTTRP